MAQLPLIPRKPEAPEEFEFLRRAWEQGRQPDPKLTVSEWADRHRILSSRGSNEAGPWRTSRTPYLRAVMDTLSPSHPARRIILMKGSQVGAALSLNTPIPTPDGWKAMGELLPDDIVFDERGFPVRVLGVSPVFHQKQCFEVEFSDGAKIIADAAHLWTVDDEKKPSSPKKRTIRTEEMAETFKCDGGKRNRYAIPVAAALVLPEKVLSIHPYALGYWLGNGTAASQQLTSHEDDAEEIAALFCSVGHTAEARILKWRKGKEANIIIRDAVRSEHICVRGHDKRIVGIYRITVNGRVVERCAECGRQGARKARGVGEPDPSSKPKSFWQKLQDANLLNNKHIPEEYLRASKEQRLALLQGLMDADGYVSKLGRCEISLSDPRLVRGAHELILSLGLKPTEFKMPGKMTFFPNQQPSIGKDSERLHFMAYRDHTPVFRLKRKLARLPLMVGKGVSRTMRRRIVDAREVPSVPVRCISVASESNLFLAGRELIATHNTEAGVNWIGYVIHHAPGPMMIVWPNLDMCRRNSKQRIETMIAECPALQERVAPQRTHSGSNTILVKEFSGGILVILGSNSASGLRSMPVRYLFLDEMDVYPPFVGKGMDPVEEVIKRTSTFEHRSKVLMASTPTIEHASRIEEQFLASNQQYFFVPCPRCGHFQQLVWERLRWEKGRFATVHYKCEACEGHFYEHEKTEFLAGGEWRATAEAADPFTVGFHISSLYSPYGWLSWVTCAKEWEAAAGSPEKQRSFCTEVLGLSWREKTDAPSWQRLYDRREEWQFGSVPPGVMLLTAGADVQRDRIEVSVWGWARGFESWLIDHIVLRGKPSEAAVWGEMTALMGRVWLAADEGNGNREAFQLRRLAIDTGDQTLEVYAWQRSVPTLPIMCVKGMDRWDREMPVSGPRRIDTDRRGKKRLRGVELYTVSVSTFKAQFYAQLSAERPTDEDLACGVAFPPGYVHLARGTPADLIQQLVSEECVAIKTRTGRVKREWRKVQDRNEGLDCRSYARAALWEADVYGEVFWEGLERERAGSDDAPEVQRGIPAERVPQQQGGGWVGRVSSRWV